MSPGSWPRPGSRRTWLSRLTPRRSRGRKRRAKTGKTDSRHLRELLAEGRLPECWIPPPVILDCRALLETYHDLGAEHTAQARLRGVLPPGRPGPSRCALRAGRCDLEALRAAAACCLSPAGQLQVATALEVLAALEARLDELRRELVDAARHLAGARELAARLYGVGPVTALANDLLARRGGPVLLLPHGGPVRRPGTSPSTPPIPSARPGGVSRQGPPVLRWAVYEADKVHARGTAPDHAYYAQVRDRKDGKRAALSEAARSSARPATSWPSSATTRPATFMPTKTVLAGGVPALS